MPSVSVQHAFELAVRHHQSGRLAEAEVLYRQILAADPQHADALHHLGIIAHQLGRHELAIEWIGRAINLNGINPAAYSNLGEAYRKLGRLTEAITSYRAALQLRSDYPDAYNNLGTALRENGQLDEALLACRRAVELRADYPEAQINLGNVLRDQGNLDGAINAYRQALVLQADSAPAHFNHGIALTESERFEEAEEAFRHGISIHPRFAEAWNSLGVVLAALGRLDEAAAAHQQALDISPDFTEAHNNLGNLFRQFGQPDRAVAAYERALSFRPTFVSAHTNLGNALRDLRQFDRARAEYRQALQLKPGDASATLSQSLLWLLCGNFEQGWPGYEARWDVNPRSRRGLQQPLYDAGRSPGTRVLIHAEQGFGDSIQFVRYAALVSESGSEVVLECQRPLVSLFKTAKGVSQIVNAGDPLPAFDAHLPMLSAPWIFATRSENIPGQTPYLFADPLRSAIWGERIGSPPARLQVGVAWSGNPDNKYDRIRNVPLDLLLPLLASQLVDFHKLQIADAARQAGDPPELRWILDYTENIKDFADTAAYVEHLDLIISVDTAVAHLAGALGRPVWTLLPFVPDWRWGLEGETTPWYSTMRLFRQPALGDWNSVIRRVADELRHLVATKVE